MLLKIYTNVHCWRGLNSPIHPNTTPPPPSPVIDRLKYWINGLTGIYLSAEDDHYNPCVEKTLRKCVVSAAIRFQHHEENNLLDELEHYVKCYEEEATNACNIPMLQHFVATIKLHKKYFEEKNGKFEEMLEETQI